jgi:hypothetical protein
VDFDLTHLGTSQLGDCVNPAQPDSDVVARSINIGLCIVSSPESVDYVARQVYELVFTDIDGASLSIAGI